ncbi:hypothetical protein SLA2020_247840 [Shorea laevis]
MDSLILAIIALVIPFLVSKLLQFRGLFLTTKMVLRIWRDVSVLAWNRSASLVIQDPELAKQILSSNFGFYKKPRSKPPIPTLTGKGLALLEAQIQLQSLCVAAISNIDIPGSVYLPTPSNLRIWKLDRKMKKHSKADHREQAAEIRKIIGNSSDCCFGDDLLGLMIAASETNQAELKLSMNEIIEECKTFYFAGYETTSNLLTWTVFLLRQTPEWQAKPREEVLNECGTGIPDADMLEKLKLQAFCQVNMVLLDALRLYSPIIASGREALEDMTLWNLMIPKHTLLIIPHVQMHRSKEYWGEDAKLVLDRTLQCWKSKTVLALILQRFSFTFSPEYKHAPTDNLFLQAQHGLPVLFRPLNM